MSLRLFTVAYFRDLYKNKISLHMTDQLYFINSIRFFALKTKSMLIKNFIKVSTQNKNQCILFGKVCKKKFIKKSKTTFYYFFSLTTKIIKNKGIF